MKTAIGPRCPGAIALNRASMAGTLVGIENVRPGRNLKIKPFVIGGSTASAAPIL